MSTLAAFACVTWAMLPGVYSHSNMEAANKLPYLYQRSTIKPVTNGTVLYCTKWQTVGTANPKTFPRDCGQKNTTAGVACETEREQ